MLRADDSVSRISEAPQWRGGSRALHPQMLLRDRSRDAWYSLGGGMRKQQREKCLSFMQSRRKCGVIKDACL